MSFRNVTRWGADQLRGMRITITPVVPEIGSHRKTVRRQRLSATDLRRSGRQEILSRVKIEIVKRSDQAKGFVALPKRWIVERTIAWLNRCRRLAKDWENLNLAALMFLRFASIRLMLRRLCNPA
jgi:transposase